jgi:Lactonase, 7-bladed beta-propeller
LSLLKLAASPTWLTFHPSGRYLYAINEVSDFDGNNGPVSAFTVDRTNGDLRFLNTVSSRARVRSISVSTPPAGTHSSPIIWRAASRYFQFCRTVLSVLQLTSVETREALGTIHATDAPPGSLQISGHDAPHAHMIKPDRDNRSVLQTDLGQEGSTSIKLTAISVRWRLPTLRLFHFRLEMVLVTLHFIPTGDGCIPFRRSHRRLYFFFMMPRPDRSRCSRQYQLSLPL